MLTVDFFGWIAKEIHASKHPNSILSFFLYDKIKSSINLYKAYEPIAIVKKTHKKKQKYDG